jgi:hypothetical protein
MVTFIEVSLNKIILMEKEFTNIKVVNYKMESGKITSLLVNNDSYKCNYLFIDFTKVNTIYFSFIFLILSII